MISKQMFSLSPPCVNFINVFCVRFSYKFLAPSYVWAWRQKFVRKTCAKNVDEIDTLCLSHSLIFFFRNLIFFICNRDLRILEMFQKTKANKHRYEWGLLNKKLHYWGCQQSKCHLNLLCFFNLSGNSFFFTNVAYKCKN